MMFSVESWVATAMDLNSSRFAGLIGKLPRSNQQANAGTFAQSASPESRVYALRFVSQDHAAGGDPNLAEVLANAGLQLSMRCFEKFGRGTADTYVFGVSQFAADAHRVYDRLGRRAEQVQVVEDALGWLNGVHADERYLVDLRFARIEGLYESGRLEEARQLLDEEQARGNTVHPMFPILDQRIGMKLRSVVERKDSRPFTEEAADLEKRVIRAGNRSFELLGSVPGAGAGFEELKKMLMAEPGKGREALASSEGMRRESEAFKKIAEFLDRSAEGSGREFQLKHAIQQATIALAATQGSAGGAGLNETTESLEATRREATELGLADVATDTLWPLYICYKRLGRFEEALEMLQLVRSRVKERRRMIVDPLKRAGISKEYPYLYKELAARLSDKGEVAELFAIMEEAKGRALTESLEIQAQREDLVAAPEGAERWAPKLMKDLGAHYISYFVDDEVTYAVCVTKKGKMHSARLEFGTTFLQGLRHVLDPSTWGKKVTGLFAAPRDVPQRLSPLVDWLGELVDAKEIRKDDHICYSPDGLLHLVPLHYIDFRGEPLVKFVSLSRTHSAALLNHFSRGRTSRPSHYVAVKAPLADEVKNAPEKVESLGRVSEWFEGGSLRGERLDDEMAGLTELAAQDLKEAVVHFATHGTFPGPKEAMSPFQGAGIVLSKNKRLPTDAKHWGLLSPERIIEQGSPFKFDGSHVTLQACVSGLSEEGIAGDALGPEWSFLMAGANSVLSTHWNIPVESSGTFSIRFYEEWLVGRRSRAEAWRAAMISQMDEKNPFDGEKACEWAAFSLAGDWR